MARPIACTRLRADNGPLIGARGNRGRNFLRLFDGETRESTFPAGSACRVGRVRSRLRKNFGRLNEETSRREPRWCWCCDRERLHRANYRPRLEN